MKHFFLRSSVLLACALGLAACGGDDDGEIPISVRVAGVTEGGLSLKLNDNPPHEIAQSGLYTFPELVPIDGSYNVTFSGKPTNTADDKPCVLSNPSGKVSTIGPNNITLTCTILTYDLGGSITGLTASGLILSNGSAQKPIPANSVSFNMTVTTGTAPNEVVTGKVPAKAAYGVLVLQQPTGQTCSVSGGNGIMPAAAVSSVVVTCVTP